MERVYQVFFVSARNKVKVVDIYRKAFWAFTIGVLVYVPLGFD